MGRDGQDGSLQGDAQIIVAEDINRVFQSGEAEGDIYRVDHSVKAVIEFR